MPGPGGVGTLLEVKVVPGASRSRILGPFGDGLRVAVAAAPERGKANAAVCELVAEALSLRPSQVVVLRGGTSPRKTLPVLPLAPGEVARRLPS